MTPGQARSTFGRGVASVKDKGLETSIALRQKEKCTEVNMSPTISIVRLPRVTDENDSFTIDLATKHRDLRLHALRTEPTSFASSYQEENQWGLDRTIAKLNNAQTVHWVAIRTVENTVESGPDDSTLLLSAQWVGFIALLGPVPSDTQGSGMISAKTDPLVQMQISGMSSGFTRVDKPITEHPDTASGGLEFHIGAVFTHQSARQVGIGRALVDAALREAESQTRRAGAPAFECTIHVDKGNASATRLYEKAGFTVVREETYAQQVTSLETGDVRTVERVALLMELRQEVN
ncbi:hypothetical protein LTR22_024314 [Elasticomyces elasticus]|nr:hypothetical protein LTR22_024314 [Elasticomyces elasticus]KAK4917965.1 hypothetical protein LTR49_014240 [Elasticomyces elasticus]KAK5743935.1 hypothetical protein LTS12_023662 [Elasticomyces elasticus]